MGFLERYADGMVPRLPEAREVGLDRVQRNMRSTLTSMDKEGVQTGRVRCRMKGWSRCYSMWNGAQRERSAVARHDRVRSEKGAGQIGD